VKRVRTSIQGSWAIVLALLVAGCASATESPAGPTPTPDPAHEPPLATTAPPATAVVTTTLEVSRPPTPAPDVSDRPAEPDQGIDYRSRGESLAVTETVLGSVEWISLRSIPLDWVEEHSFPGPIAPMGRSFKTLQDKAWIETGHCMHIYETPSGFVGLGPCSVGPDHAPDPNEPPPEWIPPMYMTIRARDVWHSEDGDEWAQVGDDVFDPGTIIMADPLTLAGHEGRWVLVGWPDPPELQGDMRPVPNSTEQAAWVSDDLVQWSRLPIAFDKADMDTWLTGIVAGEHGWVIVGVRASQGSPWSTEWAAWASTDGLEWEEFPLGVALGDPGCMPSTEGHCGRIRPAMIDGAIVLYAWTWDLPTYVYNLDVGGWKMYVGVFGDTNAD
jgi:hypothetical protein